MYHLAEEFVVGDNSLCYSYSHLASLVFNSENSLFSFNSMKIRYAESGFEWLLVVVKIVAVLKGILVGEKNG